MVAWDEKEFDKLGDLAHRKATADIYTADEIAAIVMDRDGLSINETATGYGVAQLIAQAVRMARGEEEIR